MAKIYSTPINNNKANNKIHSTSQASNLNNNAQNTDNIASLEHLLKEIARRAVNEHEKGYLFEQLCKIALQKQAEADKAYKTTVYLWKDFPLKDGADRGIDIIVEKEDAKGAKSYIAVQCKNYEEGQVLQAEKLSTFFNKATQGIRPKGINDFITFESADIFTTVPYSFILALA